MKKLIAIMAFAGVVSANAQSIDDLTISGSFDFESEYVFRGQDIADSSFQPSVELGYSIWGGDSYLGVWSSTEVSNADSTARNEVDFYIGYAATLEDYYPELPLVADFGFTYYYYPDGDNVDRSREIYFGLAASGVILEPALYYYYDFDLEQSLVELSVGHSFGLVDYLDVNASLELGAYAGVVSADDLNAGQGASERENGYTYAGITADVVYVLSDTSSASVGARWAVNNDGSSTFANEARGREHSLWFGTTLNFQK